MKNIRAKQLFGIVLALGLGLVAALGQAQAQSATCTACSQYNGTLSGDKVQQFQPNGTHYESTSAGYHKGWLRGPAGVDFDLYLRKWDSSQEKWLYVAKSDVNNTAVEEISYYGSPGHYIWQVSAYRGSGSYTLWLQVPTLGVTLKATPNSVSSGGQVRVDFTAPAGQSETDWVGLYKVGDPNNNYL